MLKNFGKFKQWTGERLGASKVTLQTEDFQQLDAETENKRTGFEKVNEASEQVYDQLSKKKPSPYDTKVKCAPLESLSNCWIGHSSDFNDDSPLGVALVNLGQTEAQIALLQEEFATTIKTDYIGVLEQGLQHYKDYYALKKKLESRRLDYDAKLSRLNKSKKEKPEWDQEMQAAKAKYEECEHLILEKMATLQDYEIDHCTALSHLMKSQLAYHQRSVDLLNELCNHMPSPAIDHSSRPPMPPITRSSTTNGSSHSANSYSLSSPIAALKPNQILPGSRKSSIDGLNRFRRAPSYSSVSSSHSNDQPPLPSHRLISPGSRPLRKAIFDFEAQAADELSFDIGDLITVVEPVDEGWWMGEMDQDGIKHRGIFPVDYTEEVIRAPSPPAMPNRPQRTTMTTTPATSLDTSTNHYERHSQQQQDEMHNDQSPFNDSLASGTPAFSRILSSASPSPIPRARSPPAPSSYGLPPTPSSTPLSRTSSFAYSTTRTPPPPPISSRCSSPSITNAPLATRPPPPPPPPSRINLTPAPSPKTGTQQMLDCQQCGCDDFSVNLFKKDQCNNCFHKHVA
ncbi:hypothetical protein [Absidia glauca]|uniref:BAR domain-containing protein n=1 Tax=Absidia glauca TaxID=4829 RepID=A0A168RQU5_ABSGL|nr:hypothetical protein [Absidia glauca]